MTAVLATISPRVQCKWQLVITQPIALFFNHPSMGSMHFHGERKLWTL